MELKEHFHVCVQSFPPHLTQLTTELLYMGRYPNFIAGLRMQLSGRALAQLLCRPRLSAQYLKKN